MELNISTFGIFHDNAPLCVVLDSAEAEIATNTLPLWHQAIILNAQEENPNLFKLYGIVDGAHRVAIVQKFCREKKIEPFSDSDFKLIIKVPLTENLRWSRFEICSAAQVLNMISDAVVSTCVFDRVKSCVMTRNSVSRNYYYSSFYFR